MQADASDLSNPLKRWQMSIQTLSVVNNGYLETLGPASMDIHTISNSATVRLDANAWSARIWNLTNPATATSFQVRRDDTIRFIFSGRSTSNTIVLPTDLGGSVWPCTFQTGLFYNVQTCQLSTPGSYYYRIYTNGAPSGSIGVITVTDSYDYAWTGDYTFCSTASR